MVTLLEAVAGVPFVVLAASARLLPRDRRGLYALAAAFGGAAWIVGGWVNWMATAHRPFVVFAALAFPYGRLPSRPAQLAVGWAGAAAVLWPVARGPLWPGVLAVIVGVAAVVGRRRVAPSVGAAGAMAAALQVAAFTTVTAAHLGDPAGRSSGTLAGWYAALIATSGCALVVGTLARSGGIAASADAAVELAAHGGPHGLALDPAASAHDPIVAAGLETATALIDEHRRLLAGLLAQVATTQAARRKLVAVEDTERRHLEHALTADTQPTIRALADEFARLAGRDDPGLAELGERLTAELDALESDLGRLVHGLPPGALGDAGLAAALGDLSRGHPGVSVMRVPAGRFPALLEGTVWFVCAEAVTNAVKHAAARRITIDVVRERGALVAVITDDGSGGARLEPGGGLTGLADRVEALGGSFELVEPAVGGTRVTARLPVGEVGAGG